MDWKRYYCTCTIRVTEEVTSRMRTRNALRAPRHARNARFITNRTFKYAAEMATGGYRSSSASSGGDNISDDNYFSEASSVYTSYSSSGSDDECMEEGDHGGAAAGCKTFTLVKLCDHREVHILYVTM